MMAAILISLLLGSLILGGVGFILALDARISDRERDALETHDYEGFL